MAHLFRSQQLLVLVTPGQNHILSSSDMLAEVTTFCVEFSRIREANSLYKLLKSLDNNEVLKSVRFKL